MKILDKQRIGWVCSYTPLELIYAANFLPYRIEGHSKPIETADSFIHPNYCQFVKSAIDNALDGKYEFLDGVVFVNSCDAMRRLHDVWKRYVPSKFTYILDLPMGESNLGVKYLKNEFKKFKLSLEKYTNKTIQEEDLRNGMKIFIESRSLYRKLDSLRTQEPPLISGEEMAGITSQFFKSNPKVWNEKIKKLIEEKKRTNLIIKKPRILLSGSPIHNIEFIKFVENCGLNVIYEDLCTGSKFFNLNIKNSADLYESLAEAYINRIPCARMMKINDRASNISELSHKLNIDGIIYHSLKFCDTYLYDVPRLKELLKEQDLKVLFIESDGMGSMNQLKTRIEAFTEIIKQ
ncbi:hypothetical protein LCGC14_0584550 [marine sediment metagenome]|uniref:2-hydroxyglutaryl-CoA dehydratase D-component n=1 Tax=marine sediment metagenome TaxID=412755 RepID=A0A0F9RFA8_9ZZZZ|nr:MAG: R-phenyllactate dehydratase beta subunit [Candidatus Lokiarchaeum sp. GC14_75]